MLFLSDGLATAGNTSRTAIVALAEERVAEGIGVSTIGVGRQFDPAVMRRLAERGGGNFYFLEDAQAVDEVFKEELKVSMTPIALDVRFALTFGRGYVLTAMAGRDGWTSTATGGTLTIPAAFAASRDGAPPTMGRRGGGGALFFDLSELDLPGADQVATVEFSYRLPGQTARHTQLTAVTQISPAEQDAPRPSVSHPAMQKLSAMYNLYRGLREATNGAASYASCTIGTLQRTRDGAARWNLAAEDTDVTADLVLIDKFIANLRRAGFPEPSEADWNKSYEQCRADAPTPYGDDEIDHQHMACSSAGAGAGAWPLLLALLAVRRRRRQPTR